MPTGTQGGYWPEYLIGHRSGSQTLYVFDRDDNRSPRTLIASVVVRTRFRSLPEFGTNWIYRCDGDWRHAEKPELKFVNP